MTKDEVEQALAALRRARVRAEEIAAATGTKLIFWSEGKVVRVEPRGKPPGSSEETDRTS